MQRDIDVAVWVRVATLRGMGLAEAKGLAQRHFEVENVDRCLRNASALEEFNEAAYERIFNERGIPFPPLPRPRR